MIGFWDRSLPRQDHGLFRLGWFQHASMGPSALIGRAWSSQTPRP